MVLALKPRRGGFLRAFGCAWFIREFLLSHGPYGAPSINPEVGSYQAEIFYWYKTVSIRVTAEDKAIRIEEKLARQEARSISPENIQILAEKYIAHSSYKAHGARYHSFVTYFSMLQKLGWVEPSGKEERSAFQANYPPGPPRKYFRLTEAGKVTSEAEWANPHMTLYGT